MRLTCPNCSAQYDIPEDMIPPEGREVQCSSCATVWFQPGADRDMDASPDGGTAASPPDRRPMADEATLDVLRQERAHEARLRAAERRRTRTLTQMRRPSDAEAAEAEAAEAEAIEPDAPRALAAAERVRMGNAASVARSRGSPAGPAAAPEEPEVPPAVPTVTDDVSEAIARTLREMSMERFSAEAQEDGLTEPADKAGRGKGQDRRQARRDLLPDIEEINSSLRPDERALAAVAEPETDMELGEPTSVDRVDRRSGFSLGFTTVLILVGFAAAVYLFATPLAEAVPQFASPLSSYVMTIDAWRVGLEARVDALAASILQDQ